MATKQGVQTREKFDASLRASLIEAAANEFRRGRITAAQLTLLVSASERIAVDLARRLADEYRVVQRRGGLR